MPTWGQSRGLPPPEARLPGSSPTRIVPRPGTTPRAARAATRWVSSARMSAATALPSRVRAVMALQSFLMDRGALRSGSAGPPGAAGAGAGTHMHPLALRAVEAEDLGGLGAGVAEPVRGVGV